MNAGEYQIDCLAKRLLPLIMSRHNISVIIFWPDKSRIHVNAFMASVRQK